MEYLFLDNFRGFTQTLLTIRDVSFFVGENSTGKTSVLSLIKILGTPYFWFDQRFNTDEVNLGNFKDIVSVGSSDKSYFRIGLVNIAPEGKRRGEDTNSVYAFLCTFTEEEGTPILSHYTAVVAGEQMHVELGASTVKYKDEGACEIRDDSEYVKSMFLNWAQGHKAMVSGYKTIRIPVERREALIFIPSLLEDISKRKHRETVGRRVSLPIRAPFGDVVWLAPIRTRPKRTYDSYRLDFSPEGDHTPYLVKKLLMRRTEEQRKQAERFLHFIEKFGKNSGLFRSISIKDYDRRTTTSPFELDIVLGTKALSVDNVGYGVSQALPVIVELFARGRGTRFAIQQPEIHLHPRAQLALGEVLFELAVTENKKFFVETQSDFIIDGFRLKYGDKKTVKKPDSQVVFFERSNAGNILYEISILDNGEISDSQPPAYREFFIKEQRRLLGL